MEGEQVSQDSEGAVLGDLEKGMEGEAAVVSLEEAPACFFGGSSWTMDHISLH